MLSHHPKMESRTPAATADPITPATLGPIACMRRKLEGLAFCPSLLATRAAMGTAETPAAPMRGLILPLESQYMSRPMRSPPTVAKAKAVFPVLPTRHHRPATNTPVPKPAITHRGGLIFS